MDNRFLDLLRKWLSGDFRQTDAERLQSLMQNDDFQREAFEGFAENSEAVSEKQVSAMRRRFDRKYGAKKEGKIVSMNWILAAAACFILVLATVWLFDKTTAKVGENGAISMTEKSTQPTEYQIVTSKKDSILSGDYQAEPAPNFDKKIAQNSAKSIISSSNLERAAPADIDEKEEYDFVKIDPKMPEKDAVLEAEKAEIAAPASAPAMAADAQIAQNQIQNYQNYPTNAKPSTPFPTENAGNEKRKSRVDADKKSVGEDAKITLENAKNGPSESKNSSGNAEKNRPEPKIGWPAFEKYILENTPTVENEPVGEVKLRFNIDKNGRPIQILVTQSVGNTCDNLAIKMLENGPDWFFGKKSVEISIRF